MFAVLLLHCFVCIVFALDSENENTQVNGQNNQLHVEAVETEELISVTILNRFKRETKVGRKRTKKWKRGNKGIEKKRNNKRNGKVRKGKRNKSKKGNKQRRRGIKNNEPHRGKQKKKNHKGRKSKNAKSTRRNTKNYRKVKSKKENKQRKRKNNKSPRSRKSKKTKSARGNPRVLTGDNCQWLDFGTARSRGSNFADGTKMVIKNKKGVRKQFLLTNGKTIYGFVRKGEKFANCSTFSEITDSVDCKSVAGLSSVTLSGSTRAVGQPSGRAYVGKGCEWIDISKVRTSGQNCADGFKFVISGEKGTRKQFLLVDGRDIIAFVKNKEKFTNCSSFTEVTAQVDCKSVSGVGAISLTGSGSPSPAPSPAPSPSTSSGCKCGIKKSEAKIVGGQNADVNEYPWMTLLLFQTDLGIGLCGGSIINSKWIVTALHCVVKNISVATFDDLEVYPVSDTRVIVGDHQLSEPNETGITKVYQAAEIVISNSGYDLALIKVDGVIDTNIYTPVCLPDTGDDFRGVDTVVTGWGRSISSFGNETIDASDILQEIVLPFLSASACDDILIGMVTNQTVENTLCFGDGEQDRGGCFGDSGGPLIVQKQGQTRWTLAGLVSAGTMEKCSAEGTYGIAVEISSFVDFIKSTAADGEFCENE